jgi:hypothetical protein
VWKIYKKYNRETYSKNRKQKMINFILLIFLSFYSHIALSAGKYGPTQLNPWTKSDCLESCNTDPTFNPALQCGGGFLPNKIGITNALLTQNPEIAQCLLDIRDSKGACMDRCSAIKEVVHRKPEILEHAEPIAIDTSVTPQPTAIETTEWTSRCFDTLETQKWRTIGISPEIAYDLKVKGIAPEKAASIAEAVDASSCEKREILVNGAWLHHNKIHWGFANRVHRKNWDWLVYPTREFATGSYGEHQGWPQLEEHNDSPDAIIADAKAYFAGHLAIPESSIVHVEFPQGGRGEGNRGVIGHRWRYVWDNYRFTVYYRKAPSIESVAEVNKQVKKEQEPTSVTCTKCKRQSLRHHWLNGFEGCLYNMLCEECYKTYRSKPTHGPCEKCGEVETYHLWDDGWSGMCYNGLCELCSAGARKTSQEGNSVEQKIELIKSKIKLAEAQYKRACQEYESHLVSNFGEQKLDSQKQVAIKSLSWYPEHCRLWQIQSHAQTQVRNLQRRLAPPEKTCFFSEI